LSGIGDGTGKRLAVVVNLEDGSKNEFEVRVLLQTPKEVEYYWHGRILKYVLRQLVGAPGASAAKVA
jgi:aconitate hydratase